MDEATGPFRSCSQQA